LLSVIRRYKRQRKSSKNKEERMDLRDAYFVDGCRTWFGKSRPDGHYWTTRADDMVTKVMYELQKRNPDRKSVV
jgi:hypothetical protein